MLTPVRRKVLKLERRIRMARTIARALKSRHHPVLAQIVPIRRCNLSCAYCNEFDRDSRPVPTDHMLARIDRLAALGTTMIDFSGGEPLLHPDLDVLIGRVRRHGMIAGLLTNGYLLSRDRIRRLNEAGLDRLQISVDNVEPDAISYKSLKVLDRKLQLLAAHAAFDVNINTVVGAGVSHPADSLVIAQRALSLGFGTSVGLMHDGSGTLIALDADRAAVYQQVVGLTRSFYSHAHDGVFQQHLIHGRPNAWRCRAGARYLYVCEDGLVHYCSQQRGHPGISLAEYGPEHLDAEYASQKVCAPRCTVSCVHRVSLLDDVREQPLQTLERLVSGQREHGQPPPATVRLLTWMFVTSAHKNMFRRLAVRAFRLG